MAYGMTAPMASPPLRRRSIRRFLPPPRDQRSSQKSFLGRRQVSPRLAEEEKRMIKESTPTTGLFLELELRQLLEPADEGKALPTTHECHQRLLAENRPPAAPMLWLSAVAGFDPPRPGSRSTRPGAAASL